MPFRYSSNRQGHKNIQTVKYYFQKEKHEEFIVGSAKLHREAIKLPHFFKIGYFPLFD